MTEETWICDKCGSPADQKISSGGKTVTICSKCLKLAIKKLEQFNRGHSRPRK